MGFALGSQYWPAPPAVIPEQTGSVTTILDADPPKQLAYGDSVIGGAVPVISPEHDNTSLMAFVPGVVSRLARMPTRLVNLMHRGEADSPAFTGNRGVIVLQTHSPNGQQTPYTSRALTVRHEPGVSPFASQFLGMAPAVGLGDG